MAVNTGAASKFAIGAANPIVEGATTGALLDNVTESIRSASTYLNGNAMKGTLSHHSNRTANGPIGVGGSFSFRPTSADLALLLPYCFGTAASGTTYALADTLGSFVIQKQTGSSGNRVFTYPTMYASAFTFAGGYGQLMTAAVDVVGLTEAVGSSFPSFTPNYANAVFPFDGLALTVGGSSYSCFDFSIRVDHAVQLQQVNSRTATAAFPTDRIVTVNLSVPAGDLLAATIADTSLAVVATFTASSGTESLVFTLPAVRFEAMSPTIGDRGEIRLPLSGQAFRTSGSRELVTTLDSTP